MHVNRCVKRVSNGSSLYDGLLDDIRERGFEPSAVKVCAREEHSIRKESGMLRSCRHQQMHGCMRRVFPPIDPIRLRWRALAKSPPPTLHAKRSGTVTLMT